MKLYKKHIKIIFFILLLIVSGLIIYYYIPENNYDKSKFGNPIVVIKGDSREAGNPVLNFDQNKKVIAVSLDDELNNCSDHIAIVVSQDNNFEKPVIVSNNKFAKAAPQAISDEKGGVHIIWGEKRGIINSRPGQLSNDIMYVKYLNGNISAPENIFHLATKDQNRGFNNFRIFYDSLNKPIVLFISPLDSISMPSLNIVKKENDKWMIHKIFDMADDFNGVKDKNNIFHSVFVCPLKINGNKTKGIYYISSKDNFSSFSEPVNAYKFNNYKPSCPRILIDNNGIIHLVWAMVVGRGNIPNSIFHSYSSDGIHWTPAEKVNVSTKGNCVYPFILKDSRNKIYLFWQYSESFPRKPSNLTYSVWDGIKWQEPKEIIDKITVPSAKIDQNDYLHITARDLAERHKRPCQLIYYKSIEPVSKWN